MNTASLVLASAVVSRSRLRAALVPAALLAGLFSTAASALPRIVLNAPMAPLFSIETNQNHLCMAASGLTGVQLPPSDPCPNAEPYGAWVDGPMNPYKNNGNTYFQLPMSENFRIRIPNHYWGGPGTWVMEPNAVSLPQGGAAMTPSQRDQLESVYNNRNWIFSVYKEGTTLYGLTHHEWYRYPLTLGGVPGFDSKAAGTYRPWIASIGWVSSTDGGTSWSMKPKTDYSRRLIAVPQPSNTGYANAPYGFMHPSNIVKEGAYYYAFTSTENYVTNANGSVAARRGVALFRTTTLASTTGWQFWNGSGWTTVDHNTYQGNGNGAQQPYVFWETSDQCHVLYAMNVRRHAASGKWITLGSKYCLPAQPDGSFVFQAVFSWTASLANPTDLEGHLSDVEQSGMSLLSNNYYSFFDVSGGAYVGDNYENIGNSPLLVVTVDGKQYYHQFLTLSGF